MIPDCSRDPTMTELILIGLRARLGTVIAASNEPMAPVSFSRTTTFMLNTPGGSSRSVWYCTFLRSTFSSADTARFTVSRIRATGLCCGSRTTPTMSIVALLLSPDLLNGTLEPGTMIQTGTKYRSPFIRK